LRPKDTGALAELAGMELQRADELLTAAQQAQVDAATNSPAPLFAPSTTKNPLSQALTQDPISQGLTQRANDAVQRVQNEYQAAEGDYLRLTKATPTDSNAQLELALVAQQIGDVQTALNAYKRFLKLAPDDPSAPLARQRLKQLGGALQAQIPPKARAHKSSR
jgi:regulator of sirC expression with transglutaminase-like and TPR domain